MQLVLQQRDERAVVGEIRRDGYRRQRQHAQAHSGSHEFCRSTFQPRVCSRNRHHVLVPLLTWSSPRSACSSRNGCSSHSLCHKVGQDRPVFLRALAHLGGQQMLIDHLGIRQGHIGVLCCL